MSKPASRPTGRSEACREGAREIQEESGVNVFPCLLSSEQVREQNKNMSITEAFLSDDKTIKRECASERSMHIVEKREIARIESLRRAKRMRKRKRAAKKAKLKPLSAKRYVSK